MRKLNRLYNLFLPLVISLALFSCNDDETAINTFEEGIFVVNEGNFNEGDGSISFYNPSSEAVEFNVYSKNNADEPLGDVVQSMTLDGDKAYIIVNNDNKIEVVDSKTMKGINTIEQVSLPRYMVISGDKGYVTEWVSFTDPGRVAVINTTDFTVTNTIEVGYGAEYLLVKDNKLYVTNNFESTVSVIDLNSETIMKTISVGSSPSYMVEDADGKIWIMCAGGYNQDYSPANDGALYRIDPVSNTVEDVFELNTNSSGKIAINPSADIIYFMKENKIYAHSISSAVLPETPIITNSDFVGIYGIGVNPTDGIIYLGDNKSFQSNGIIFRYQPDGSLINSFEAGRGPNGFVFIP